MADLSDKELRREKYKKKKTRNPLARALREDTKYRMRIKGEDKKKERFRAEDEHKLLKGEVDTDDVG